MNTPQQQHTTPEDPATLALGMQELARRHLNTIHIRLDGLRNADTIKKGADSITLMQKELTYLFQQLLTAVREYRKHKASPDDGAASERNGSPSPATIESIGAAILQELEDTGCVQEVLDRLRLLQERAKRVPGPSDEEIADTLEMCGSEWFHVKNELIELLHEAFRADPTNESASTIRETLLAEFQNVKGFSNLPTHIREQFLEKVEENLRAIVRRRERNPGKNSRTSFEVSMLFPPPDPFVYNNQYSWEQPESGIA